MKRYEVDGAILIVNGTLNIEKAGKVLDEILSNVLKRRQGRLKDEMSNNEDNQIETKVDDDNKS